MIYLLTADGGHGMNTGGKRTPKFANGTFMHEREFNQATVNYLKQMADKIPNLVFLDVAPENNDVPLATRVNRANAKFTELKNKHGASNVKAVHVSIHANALTGVWGSQNGQETYHCPGSVEGEKLARSIHKELVKGTKLGDRGVKSANFYMVKAPNAPAALVEAAFMDNLKEAELLLSNEFRREVASEVLQGVLNYFKINGQVEEVKKKYFRIRKTWSNDKSQIGAFTDLNKAIETCQSLPGFNVYDDDGKLVYSGKELSYTRGLEKIQKEAETKQDKVKKKKWFFKK